jgi:glyoxylase-like metal-dependent hydrolase (beta-lactamase superfamily II)
MDESGSRDGEPQLIDVCHLGRPEVIGAWRVGDVLVDPGPSSSLGTLMALLEREPPRAIALTHIHLDHAGSAWTLSRRFPDAEVWVHERGAPHLVDPSRLLASAGRLYGERMERLWGEVLAVPSDRIRALGGGEQLPEGLRVAYTPGHASHHVAYLHEPSGFAFAGDVAGVRIDSGPTLAPTPPPDIDLEQWRRSIDVIAGWRPQALAITHFGAHPDVQAHLQRLRDYLDAAEQAAALGEAGFAAAFRARVAASASGENAATYEQAMPPDQSYAGLRRHLERAV